MHWGRDGNDTIAILMSLPQKPFLKQVHSNLAPLGTLHLFLFLFLFYHYPCFQTNAVCFKLNKNKSPCLYFKKIDQHLIIVFNIEHSVYWEVDENYTKYHSAIYFHC